MPIAYIQRIVVKSVFNIPVSQVNVSFTDSKTKYDLRNLYMIDAFRTPIAQLFELNEFIRNFRTENHSSNSQKSLTSDLCVHVGELAASSGSDRTSNTKQKEFNKHYLPEFNCLYLSPTNFWSNDFGEFKQDDDLMQTINEAPDFMLGGKNTRTVKEGDSEDAEANADNISSEF